MIYLCYSAVWHNPLFRITTDSTEAAERTQSNTEQASRAKRVAGVRFSRSVSGLSNYHRTRRRERLGPTRTTEKRRAYVWGDALKMNGNFWVLPRASLSSAAEAQNYHAIRAYDSVSSHHAPRACEVNRFAIGKRFAQRLVFHHHSTPLR